MSKKSKQKTDVNHKLEYDLESSLKKIKQNGMHDNNFTFSDFSKPESNSPLSSAETSINKNENTQTNYQNVDAISSKLDKVNGDINDVKDRINTSSEGLRKELEGKIDKKLDHKWFISACAVLSVICVLIYTLSYSGLVSKVESNSSDLKDQKNQILNNSSSVEKIEEKIETIKQKQDQTDKSLYELNFKTKK